MTLYEQNCQKSECGEGPPPYISATHQLSLPEAKVLQSLARRGALDAARREARKHGLKPPPSSIAYPSLKKDGDGYFWSGVDAYSGTTTKVRAEEADDE